VLNDSSAHIEFYNLGEDKSEDNNVAMNHPNVVLEMERIFKDARTPSNVFTFGRDTYLNSK